MFDLTGKKLLITGATGGLGQAMARSFYFRGCALALHGTNIDRLQAFAEQLEDQAKEAARENNNPIRIFQADLADRGATKKLAKDVLEIMGGIDILINNAGITRDGLFIRMADKDFDDVLSVNLLSAFSLTQELSRAMIKQRFGRIINITSVVAATGNPGQTNYCAAKAGLIGFTKALAKELATKGVTANCIAPGFIESAMTEKLNEKQKEQIMASIPMKRMGQAEDIAAAALFLASDGAAYITGQTLHINGGMAML